ncbi:MAG TPA: aminotransferase class IV [Luteolibacter sp.]
MSRTIWCDGRLIPADELRISPFDRGLTVGLGLFETILAIDGRPVFLDRHLARHADGCHRLGWGELDAETIRRAIFDLLTANGLEKGRARVRVFQTAGEGLREDPVAGPEAKLLLTAWAVSGGSASVSLTLSPWVRNERSALAGMKAASYAENVLALAAARKAGFEEPLFLNSRGEVCETATANFFIVKDGRIFTPPLASGCLPGVTRGWLLEFAGADAEERILSPGDLATADEWFLTSAVRGVIPVDRWGDQTRKAPGEWTSRLQKTWENAVIQSAKSEL